MAYVLGYWYADGSLEDASYLRGKYIRVTSIDRQTIENIRKWLRSQHKIVTLEPTDQHPGRVRYFLRIGSHVLYDDLVELGLYPHKSLTVKFPQIPVDFLKDFVRGYFDGDGCVYLQLIPNVRKEKINKRLSVIFTSGSFDFLTILCRILEENLGLMQRHVYRGRRAFQLRYSTTDSLKIFEFLYANCSPGCFLKRKLDVFSSYCSLSPRGANRRILEICSSLNHRAM